MHPLNALAVPGIPVTTCSVLSFGGGHASCAWAMGITSEIQIRGSRRHDQSTPAQDIDQHRQDHQTGGDESRESQITQAWSARWVPESWIVHAMAAELHIIFERRPWSLIASRPALNSHYGIASIRGITPKEHATNPSGSVAVPATPVRWRTDSAVLGSALSFSGLRNGPAAVNSGSL
jgi:hypothetical protein